MKTDPSLLQCLRGKQTGSDPSWGGIVCCMTSLKDMLIEFQVLGEEEYRTRCSVLLFIPENYYIPYFSAYR